MLLKLVCLLLVGLLFVTFADSQKQREVFLGELPNLSHGTGGQVYALDNRTLMIRNLNYDGQAPDAYFWAGTTTKPGVTGFKIPDENGKTKPLKGYRDATVVLKLPHGKTLRDIKYFGLWCRKFQVNFGHININFN